MKLRHTRIFAAGAMLAVFTQFTAWADFIDWPVKWSQPIGFNGATIIGEDRLSDHSIPWIMADDFTCTDPKPVMALRWWGSYVDSPILHPNSPGFTVPFEVGFLSSVGPHPDSLPGVQLYQQPVLAQEVFVGIDQQGDFVYRYDAFLPVPFNQVQGTEYFLNIDSPGFGPSGERWGWHDAAGPHPIQDWAAFSPIGNNGQWFTYQTPRTDLAFEIMIPEPSTSVLAIVGGGLLLSLTLRRRK